MSDSKLYFDISNQERDSAIRYLLGAIIKSRTESNFPSNQNGFDEDVNVYLAHLLFAISLPEYHEMSEPYLSTETSDILQWVRATEDRTIRYFIFKVNADHILIHTAIFDDIVKKPQMPSFKRSANHYRELAQVYYEQAAQYHQRIYRKQTGVGEVLIKIAKDFDAYQNLLKHVRKEYFGFMNHFRDQVFSQFMQQMHGYEKENFLKIKIDELLDMYSRWKQTQDPQLGSQIQLRAKMIRELDPDFHFVMDPFEGGESNERKCA